MELGDTFFLALGIFLSYIIIFSRTYRIPKKGRIYVIITAVSGLLVTRILGFTLCQDFLKYSLPSSVIVTGLLYELFDWITWKTRNRSLYIHAKHSSDYTGSGFSKRSRNANRRKFGWTDILFSLILIISLVCSPFLLVILIKKICLNF